MAAEIADVPGRGRTAAPDLGGDVHDGDEIELHAAERLGLVVAEQACLVQQLLVLADQDAGVFRLLRPLAQHRHDLARPPHGLFVADAGEIAPLGLGKGANVRSWCRVAIHLAEVSVSPRALAGPRRRQFLTGN